MVVYEYNSLLEPSGWITPHEMNLPLKGWIVEVPEAAVPRTLRDKTKVARGQAERILGERISGIRWYRTTRDHAVALAQWDRTAQEFSRLGVEGEPLLYPQHTDLNGGHMHTVTKEQMSACEGKVEIEVHDETRDTCRGESGVGDVLLMADPAAFDAVSTLDEIIAHEIVHVIQAKAGHPLWMLEPMAYTVSEHWGAIVAGYFRASEAERRAFPQMLRRASAPKDEIIAGVKAIIDGGTLPKRMRQPTAKRPKPAKPQCGRLPRGHR